MLTALGRAASIGRRSLALLLFLGSAGCATGPAAPPAATPPRPLRVATLDEVLAAYDSYCLGLQSFSASGDLDVRDTRSGRTHKLGVRVVAARGGRLYLKGSVVVVTAFEITSDGERFWFQVPSRKTMWTGDAAGAPRREPERPAYEALRPRDILEALLPEPIAPQPGQTLLLEADRQSFSLVLGRPGSERGSVQRRVVLHRESLVPLRSRSYDERGELVAEVGFGAWREGVPRAVSISRAEQGYEVAFAFTKVETNLPALPKVFAPRATPEGYRLVEVPS